ncbi:hypothetical protein [Bacillus thuringiensis]|nr:hypothetical protein [Bacillus thuringiensis]MCU7667651.1 hypothetical protein [Bacillus thuringiensis]
MKQEKTTGYKELDKVLSGEVQISNIIYGKPTYSTKKRKINC